MAYTINKTDGTKLVALRDGTVDIATTDLALFGKGYAGFGERLNENFVKVLENFANTTAPANKIKGQLWYDTLANQIKVWNGSKFKPVGASTTSAAQPTNANTGDMWFDTNNSQLYVYSSTAWTLIGPTAVAGSGVTQVSPDVIKDNAGVNKSILKFITNDTTVGIVSAEEFTPQTAIVGFSSIFKGITLSTSVSSAKFIGTATNADRLGGELPASYIRSDTVANITGTLSVLNNGGVTIGAGSNILISMSGDDARFRNFTSNGNLEFYVNDGGSNTRALYIEGATHNVNILNDILVGGNAIIDGNLTVTGTQFVTNTVNFSVEDNIIELNRNVSSAAGMPNYSGIKVKRGSASSATEQDLYWVWDETFADDGTTTYGNAGGAWTAFKSGGGSELSAATLVDLRANIVHASATQAQYADLAENYIPDHTYDIGTVMAIGGTKEITAAQEGMTVIGVVSGSPAFLMNSTLKESIPVAIKGRVPVKIHGAITKGDRIGIGKIIGSGEKTLNLDYFAISLHDDNHPEMKLVECFIR